MNLIHLHRKDSIGASTEYLELCCGRILRRKKSPKLDLFTQISSRCGLFDAAKVSQKVQYWTFCLVRCLYAAKASQDIQ